MLRLTFVLVSWFAGPLASQTLVKDINADPVSTNAASSPHELTSVHGRVVFAATLDGQGDELFATDGTPAGTGLLLDINVGASDSLPANFSLLPASGDAVFSAQTPTSGQELWRTDGTAAGTELVLDIVPGALGSFPREFTELGGELIFVVVNDWQLWKTDGTSAGTQLVTHPAATSLEIVGVLDGWLYYTYRDAVTANWELWRTDGTSAGVELYQALGSEPVEPGVVFDAKLFFPRTTVAEGRELWRLDGSPGGMELAVDLEPGPGNGGPVELTVLGDELLFSGFRSDVGRELWKTDGSALGTELIQDINDGPSAQISTFYSSPVFLGTLGDYAYFSARSVAAGRELWRTDGSSLGTELWLDIEPGPTGSNPVGAVVNGRLYVLGEVEPTGTELYVSDGTPGGTLSLGPGASTTFAADFAALGSQTVFRGPGDEPWITDGTEPGTTLLEDFNLVNGTASASVDRITRVGNNVLLRAVNSDFGPPELWTSDGTEAGTVPLADVTNPKNIVVHENGVITLSATTGSTGEELWISDGTPVGTELVADLRQGSLGSSPGPATLYNGLYYFSASVPAIGRELWVSDGTEAGTDWVANIAPGAASSSPTPPIVLGDKLVFAAVTSETGTELWRSDGTAEGTELIVEIHPSSGSILLSAEFARFGDALYFPADDGVHGVELWRTDGTAAGTELVADIHPSGDSNPESFLELNGSLIFAATEPFIGVQPWRTDGLTTERIQIVGPAQNLSGVNSDFVSNGQFALFWVDNLANTSNLFRTDGTAAGTDLVLNVEPTGLFGPNQQFGAAGSGVQIVLGANDGVSGQEPWISDGTPAGTQLLFDVQPGGGSSFAGDFVRAGSRVFFSADDGVHGLELHAFDLVDLGQYVAESIGSGCPGSDGSTPSLEVLGAAALGQPFDLVLSDGPSLGLALRQYSLGSTVLPLGGGCTSYLLAPTFLEALSLDGDGSSQVTVTPLAGLVGVPIALQDVVLDAGGSFLGLGSLTNALELVVGY